MSAKETVVRVVSGHGIWGIVAVAALSAVLVGGAVWQVASWLDRREDARMRLEMAELRWQADSLEKVAVDLERGEAVYARRVRILTDGLMDKVLENLTLHREIEQKEIDLQLVSDMYVSARDELVFMTDLVASADSTTIPLSYSDSLFDVDGSATFPGRVVPDPEPPANVALTLAARIRTMLAIGCEEETGDLVTNVGTFDPRVAVDSLEVSADPRATCWPEPTPPGLGELLPRPSIGTGIVAAISFVAGLLAR